MLTEYGVNGKSAPLGRLPFILLAGLALSAWIAASCSGSCTYNPSGSPSMITWSASCSGNSILNHVSADALVGSTGYPCTPGDSVGSSSFTQCGGTFSGQEQWTNKQGTITGGSIQIIDDSSNVYSVGCAQGSAPSCPSGYSGTPPNCVAPTCQYGGAYPNCNPPPNGGGGGTCPYGGTYPNCNPAPSCPAGYSGTYPNCVAPACQYGGTYPNCNAAPFCNSVNLGANLAGFQSSPYNSMQVSASCQDQYNHPYPCPSAPTYSLASGPGSFNPSTAAWTGMLAYPAQVALQAHVSGCANPTGSYTFGAPYCQSSIAHTPMANPMDGATFSANCATQYASFSCLSAPSWSASYGSLSSVSGPSVNWYTAGLSALTVQATVSQCAPSSSTYYPGICTSSIVSVPDNQSTQDLSPGSYTNPSTGHEFYLASPCSVHSPSVESSTVCPTQSLSWTSSSGLFINDPFSSDIYHTYWLSQGSTQAVNLAFRSTYVTPQSGFVQSCTASTVYTPPYCAAYSWTAPALPRPSPLPNPNAVSPIATQDLNLTVQCYDQYSPDGQTGSSFCVGPSSCNTTSGFCPTTCQGERIDCPSTPAFSINSSSAGTFLSMLHDVPTDTFSQVWNASSVYGPFRFTSAVTGCTNATQQKTYTPPPVCNAFNLSFGAVSYPGLMSSQNGLDYYPNHLPSDFWGYNWSDVSIAPSRLINYNCLDQYDNPIACNPRFWNATLGSFQSDSSVGSGGSVVWVSSNAPGGVTLDANASYCAASNVLSFRLHILNSCQLLPDNLPATNMTAGVDQNFSGTCFDETGAQRLCPYPLWAHLVPDGFGSLSSTQYWGPGEPWIPSPTPVPLPPLFQISGDDAAVLAQVLPPDSMVTGNAYQASVTMNNTGNTTWQSCNFSPSPNNSCVPYSLHLVHHGVPIDINLPDYALWQTQPPLSFQVLPGQNVTFPISLTAPMIPGTYPYQFQMCEAVAGCFGQATEPQSIRVENGSYSLTGYGQLATPPDPANQYGDAAGNNASLISQKIPPYLIANQIFPLDIVLNNSGTTNWVDCYGNNTCGVYGGKSFPSVWGSTVGGKDFLMPGRSNFTPGTLWPIYHDIQAPATAGTYPFQMQMCNNNDCFGTMTPAVNITVYPTGSNNAQFISQTIPGLNAEGYLSLPVGQSFNVSVSMNNTGITNWSDCLGGVCGVYRLELFQNGLPADPALYHYSVWNHDYATLDYGSVVTPGSTNAFNFPIQTPLTPGFYQFQWRMCDMGSGCFGDLTPLVNLLVLPWLQPVIWGQTNVTVNASGNSGSAVLQAVGPSFTCQTTLATPCNTPPNVLSFQFPGSTTTDFAALAQSGKLESVPRLVLDRPDVRLSYSSDVAACGQDFDGGIRTANGFIAMDSPRFSLTVSHPSLPVTITMKNMAGSQTPRLFVMDGFAQTAQDVFRQGMDCQSVGRCSNVSFDPTAHTLMFQTNGFSSYAAGGLTGVNNSAPLPPNVRLVLNCPLPQLGQNLTKASAFLYVDGRPQLNRTMALDYTLNSTYAFEATPVSTDASSGRHDFIFDTRFSGRYFIFAQSGNWTSNTCPVDVFQQQSTQLPEIDPAVILGLFLAAGFLVQRRNR